MTLLTLMTKDPVPPGTQFDTAPISPPAPGTQLVTTLQWNNLIDLLQGTSVDEIDTNALEALTFNFAMITDGTGHIAVSPTTAAELAFVSGLTSAIQTQLNGKEPTIGFTPEDAANKGAISGYAGLDASQLLLLTNFPSGAGLEILRRNAGNTALEFAAPAALTLAALTDTTITAAAAHESLVRNAGNTAWVNELIDNLNLATGVFANITGLGTLTQDLNLGGNNMIFSANGTQTSGSTAEIFRNGDDIRINVATGDDVIIGMDGDAIFRFLDGSPPALDFQQNGVITSLGKITFDFTQQTIDASSSGLQLDSSTFTILEIGGTSEYFFTAQEIDMLGNWITDAGRITMQAGAIEFAKGTDVVAAAQITLTQTGNIFDITGATTINEIVASSWQPGSTVTLQFDGAPLLVHNSAGTNDLLLAGGVNFQTVAGNTITFFYNGTDWVETSRSAGIAGVTSISEGNSNITVADAGTGTITHTLDGTAVLNMNLIRTFVDNRFSGAEGTKTNISSNMLIWPANGNFIRSGSTNGELDKIRKTDFQSGSIVYLRFEDFATNDINHGVAGTGDDRGLFLKERADNVNVSTDDIFAFMFDGATDTWREIWNTQQTGGGEFLGPMTALHDYAGFNIGFKTASPITLGQGATNVLSATFLDDTVDAGMKIGNTDGFILFSNESAVAGDNQMELKMESGGAATIQNVMRFTVPVADDTGTTPVLRMDFADAAGGPTARPMMAITHGATEMVRITTDTDWTFHAATEFIDLAKIHFVGATTDPVADRVINLDAADKITWDGAATSTPNYITFSDSDVFSLFINNVQKFQVTATQANFLAGIINGVTEYQFQTGTGSIAGVANGVVIDSPTQTDFEIGGTPKFFFNSSFLDMGGLNIKNLASIRGDEAGTPEVLTFTTVTSAVNEVNLLNAIATANPVISAQGTDTNIHLELQGKGTEGAVFINDHLILNDNIQQFKGTDFVAAANISPRNGNFFDITGATTIDFMVDDLFFQAGSVVTLQFDGAPLITHNKAAPPTNFSVILLDGNIDFQTAAGDTLTIVFDGLSWLEIGRTSIQTPGFTMVDGEDIAIGTTTGTKFGTSTSDKLAFYNSTPIVQPTALTAAETTLTFVDENTPDFALSSLTTTSAAGFATLDEAQAFVEVVVNMQLRIGELETKLAALGLTA